MNRRLLANFAFLCVTFSSFSQNKNAHTLLWRISGNGLKQSSYLFGSMHLTDKRLFNFDDSLYHALEITDGTAIEVNPDEMMAYTFNQELEKIQNGKYLKDILNEKDYQKYSAALSKKLNKPASEITERDLTLEKNSWTTDYLAKGEMPTFLDAYLFFTAKKQGKWVGGIEDITDQAGLLESVDKTDIEFMLKKDAKDVRDNSLEYMISLYSSQDVDGIYQFTSQGDSAQHDAILTKRNKKMSYRIDSIGRQRSMLFVIGAAHLGGDDGVINLLRKRGFTVTPVIGSKKISSKDYKVVEKPIPWSEVKDKQGFYTAQMPGNPYTAKIMGLIEAKFYFDLSSYAGYITMATISSIKTQNKDSVYNIIASSVFKNESNLKGTPITKDGISGIEYVSSLNGVTARVQMFLRDKALYMPMFYALKKDSLFGVNAKKFFDSFTMNDIPVSDGIVYEDTAAGVVTSMPLQLEYNPQMSQVNAKGWRINAFAGADVNTGAFIAKFVKTPIKGDNIANDSLVFVDTRGGMLAKMKETKYERLKIDGHNAMYMEGTMGQLHGRLLNIIRGNHSIGIMAVGDSAAIHTPAYENIFKNVRFVPYKNIQWKAYTLAGKSLTMWAPSEFIGNDEDTTLGENRFLSYDSSSALNIVVAIDTLKKYAWYSSDDAFWKEYNKNIIKEEDSVVLSANSKRGNNSVHDIIIKRGATEKSSHIKQYQYGNIVYQISLTGEPDVLNTADVDKLLNDVQFNKPAANFILTESRAALLINDLSSKDSAIVDGAFEEMGDVDFDSTNILLLHDCLLKKYAAPNANRDSFSINDRAAEILSRFSSPRTVKFASDNYNSLPVEKQYLKETLLYQLSMITTKQSYDSLFSLIKANPKDNLFSTFSTRVTDSLQLVANYQDVMLSFLKDTSRGMQMTTIINELSDSILIALDKIKKYENDFIALSKHDLTGENTSRHSFDLIEILAKIKTPKSLAAVRAYLNVKDQKYIKKRAVLSLLKNNQPVNATILNGIAADKETRNDFYYDLKDIKKQALFPKQYLTQKSLGESALLGIVSDEDYDVKTITFVAEKTANYKNKKYKFQLFKVTFDNDGGSYLGVAGGYDIDGKSVEPKEDLSSMYYEEEFDGAKLNQLFKAWLEGFEEDK